MAEFSEIMRQLKRMCDYNAKRHSDDICSFCPFDCGAITNANTNWNEFAEVIEKWAAEHPEPQYPTWAELLYQDFLIWCQEKYPGRAKDEKAWFDYIYETHIPVDIAEKLGLKPKGVKA